MPLQIMINALSKFPIQGLHLLGRLQINFICKLNNDDDHDDDDSNNNNNINNNVY